MPRHLGCGEGRLLDSGLNDLSWTADLKGLLRPKEVELDRLIALEEYYWKQRSRSEWLKEYKNSFIIRLLIGIVETLSRVWRILMVNGY